MPCGTEASTGTCPGLAARHVQNSRAKDLVGFAELGLLAGQARQAEKQMARLTMPTSLPSRTTGTRLMPCRSICATISDTGVSGETVTTARDITSFRARQQLGAFSRSQDLPASDVVADHPRPLGGFGALRYSHFHSKGIGTGRSLGRKWLEILAWRMFSTANRYPVCRNMLWLSRDLSTAALGNGNDRRPWWDARTEIRPGHPKMSQRDVLRPRIGASWLSRMLNCHE